MKLKTGTHFQQGTFFHGLLLCSLFLIVSCGGILPESEPKIISSSPSEQNNTDFPLNRGFSVTFNKEMEQTSLSETTFFIHETGATIPLAGKIATDGITASLKPEKNLKFSTRYILTVTQAVRDLSGNSISEVFQLVFTTLAAPAPLSPGSEPNPDAGLDTDPPIILSTSPSNNEFGVPLQSTITVTFNEFIDLTSLTEDSFDINKGTKAKNLFLSGRTAVFEPEEDLRSNEDYSVTITTGIKDLAGNALVSNFTWTFSTEDDEEEHEDGFN
ncbi:hypothetical protein MNBD_NITROSPIRAE01-2085 [hydrothermal vent metagenome]|uniref:SbsA Ig-like domain-containing protein n=1 Tax=hydrothermal vent metagenome TaxID=652676 RepID=A0A3B1D4Q2_9ZZZZ